MKVATAIFVGEHHDAKGQPLVVVRTKSGKMVSLGTVDEVEGLLRRYREHVLEQQATR